MSSSLRMAAGIAAVRAAFAAAAAERRPALITYLTLGYPDPAASLRLVPALQAGGADIIELGVPFSDPVADGPAIQRASYAALQSGISARDCLALATSLRQRGVTVPLLFMGYYNPIHTYGPAAYARECATAGIDGLIVPDLPPEEAAPLADPCQQEGLALVYLTSPTTSEARLARLARETTGFLYVVSRLGTTGVSNTPSSDLPALLATVRRLARTPVALGFGISRPEQAAALVGQTDGIIVGSAIVERATDGPAALRAYVESLRAAIAPS